MLDKIIQQLLNQLLLSVTYLDRTAGIVRTQTKNDQTETGIINKKFPVYWNTKTACSTSDYYDLIPNGNYKSTLYFEDNGTQFIDCNFGQMNYISTVRLVCHVNLKRINTILTDTYILESVLMNNMPDSIANFDYFSKIIIQNVRPVTKDVNIFSRYTYNEAELQYLMYPFDYFAYDIIISWSVAENCAEELTLNPSSCTK